jgi:hypothetical protein
MRQFVLGTIALAFAATAQAQSGTPITPDNFKRAETDMYFAMFVKRGAFGKFFHFRELPLEGTGVRPNRDTLYSQALFDLDAGPVTITLPDAGKRFMAMQVFDQDHYSPETAYVARDYTYTRQQIGTRYFFVAVRILVNPADPKDVKEAHASGCDPEQAARRSGPLRGAELGKEGARCASNAE